MSRKFNWQINASSVAALLGKNKFQTPEEALAKTWQMNLKRMPRFGVTPSFSPTTPTTAQMVTQKIEQQHASLLTAAIDRNVGTQQAVQDMKTTADQTANVTQKKAVQARMAVKSAQTSRELHLYPNIATGVTRTKIRGYFCVKDKVYCKLSRKSSVKRSMREANEHGWFINKQEIVKEAQRQEKVAVSHAIVANKVAKNIVKQATKSINTRRGIQKEATDLELVQRKFPSVQAGNNKSYFLNVCSTGMYNAFIIGRIDGFDERTQTIFELKSRASRLFRNVSEYEEIQCMIYAKMLRKQQVMLVETFKGEQLYYPLSFSNGVFGPSKLVWTEVQAGLENVVHALNRIEQDPEYRQQILNILY